MENIKNESTAIEEAVQAKSLTAESVEFAKFKLECEMNLMRLEHIYDPAYDLVLNQGSSMLASEKIDFKKEFEDLDGSCVTPENKNGFNYITWSKVYKELYLKDPNVRIVVHQFYNRKYKTFMPYEDMQDAGLMVHTGITFKGQTYNMFLPILNSMNLPIKYAPYNLTFKSGSRAIPGLTVQDINKSILRCIVKTTALLGYGLRLWTNEDLPEEDDEEVDSTTGEVKSKKRKTKSNNEAKATEKQLETVKSLWSDAQINTMLKNKKYNSVEDFTKEEASELIKQGFARKKAHED